MADWQFDEQGACELALNQLDQVDTVFLGEDSPGGTPWVGCIDQTLLPGRLVVERLACKEDAYRAIQRLEVRGAPAIGVCAALAAYMDAWQVAHGGPVASDTPRVISTNAPMDPEENPSAIASAVAAADTPRATSVNEPADLAGFMARWQANCAWLEGARPTAVNLSWALRRMQARASREIEALAAAGRSDEPSAVPTLLAALRDEARAIRDEDVATCRAIGEQGAELLRELAGARVADAAQAVRCAEGTGACGVASADKTQCSPVDPSALAPSREPAGPLGILTHCNAGRLCAVRYGTATAPVYVGRERGLDLRVFCDETRPLLQGARLTALELCGAGVDTTLICDNMSATMMRNGLVDAIFVGCDRVAANGDTANKIGTSMVALAARYYGVPFYVCAPTSTVDLGCASGRDIVIEERAASEVTELWYAERMAPQGVGVRNPSFDVTDAGLITAFVTEKGVVYPPFGEGLARVAR